MLEGLYRLATSADVCHPELAKDLNAKVGVMAMISTHGKRLRSFIPLRFIQYDKLRWMSSTLLRHRGNPLLAGRYDRFL